jgi:transglutaminase-like putative cysteine protease
LVLLTPREDTYIRCSSHKLQVFPRPQTLNHRRDIFGNHLVAFSIEESHRQLVVTAKSRVTVIPQIKENAKSPPWQEVVSAIRDKREPEWLEVSRYLYDSPRIHRGPEFSNYAFPDFAQGRPILDAILQLTRRIHREFVYDPTVTGVHTMTREAFLLRRGVCQDFAHTQIACLRSLGIPARYVSGYLRTLPPPGQARMIGADQSHAWVSAYCGADLGWVDFDPTNNCLSDANHVPIAWGRDYSDVAPLRGVFLGGGHHTLAVSVDVAPYVEKVTDG